MTSADDPTCGVRIWLAGRSASAGRPWGARMPPPSPPACPAGRVAGRLPRQPRSEKTFAIGPAGRSRPGSSASTSSAGRSPRRTGGRAERRPARAERGRAAATRPARGALRACRRHRRRRRGGRLRPVVAYTAKPSHHAPEPPPGAVVFSTPTSAPVEAAFAALGDGEWDTFLLTTPRPPVEPVEAAARARRDTARQSARLVVRPGAASSAAPSRAARRSPASGRRPSRSASS